MPVAPDANWQYQQNHRAETRVPELIGTSVAFLAISYIGVLLRILSRRLNKVALRIDDWLIVASLIFTTGFAGLSMGLIPFGFGRHQVVVTDPAALSKGLLSAELLYCLSLFTIKISTLYLLHRIFPTLRFKYALWGLGMVILAYSATLFFCVLLQCVPLRALWDPRVQGHCIDLGKVWVVCSSLNIVTDVAIMGLPMPKTWALQMKTKQKMQLTMIFFLGGFVCIVSIVRQTYVSKFSSGSRFKTVDSTWLAVDGAIWSFIECGLATLCACLPTLRPLYRYVFHSRNDSSARNRVIASEGLPNKSKPSVVSHHILNLELAATNLAPNTQFSSYSSMVESSRRSYIPLGELEEPAETREPRMQDDKIWVRTH